MMNDFKKFEITNTENVVGGGKAERIAARRAARKAARIAARNNNELIDVDIIVIDYVPVN